MKTDTLGYAERRQFWRAGFQASAQMVLRDGARDAAMMNISMDGALLELASTSMPAPGEPCELRLELNPGGETIVMQASVSHVGPGGRVGLRRASIDCDSLTLLRRLLELNTGDAARTEHELLTLSRSG